MTRDRVIGVLASILIATPGVAGEKTDGTYWRFESPVATQSLDEIAAVIGIYRSEDAWYCSTQIIAKQRKAAHERLWEAAITVENLCEPYEEWIGASVDLVRTEISNPIHMLSVKLVRGLIPQDETSYLLRIEEFSEKFVVGELDIQSIRYVDEGRELNELIDAKVSFRARVEICDPCNLGS